MLSTKRPESKLQRYVMVRSVKRPSNKDSQANTEPASTANRQNLETRLPGAGGLSFGSGPGQFSDPSPCCGFSAGSVDQCGNSYCFLQEKLH